MDKEELRDGILAKMSERHGRVIAKVAHRAVGNLANSDYITENTFFIGVYPRLTDAK